jgi:hypothetical protein
MISPLGVLGYGYVAPSQVAPGEPPKLDLGLLERTLRRGLSDTTRYFMHAAKLAVADAAVDPSQLHVVFASAFGEIATAEALMLEAYTSDASSPARFRNSVHNTSPGLLSISTQNRLPSTAISAGWDTVAMGLCEASAQLADGAERVLLVFAEERVPPAICAQHTYEPLGVAFVLTAAFELPRKATLSHLRRVPSAAGAVDGAAIGEHDHPLQPALTLAQSIEHRRARTLVVGEGSSPFCIDVRIEVEA